MRVWLLTSEMPQEFAGGIARYIDNHARILGDAGHQVTIISRTREISDQMIGHNVRLIGLQPRDHLLSLPNESKEPDKHPAYPYNIMGYWQALSYQFANAVLELLRTEPHPDIIESQEYAGLPYFLLQRKLTQQTPLENIPIIVHLHSPWFDLVQVNQAPRYKFPDYWVGQMEKFCINASDGLLSPSRFLATSIRETMQQNLDIATIPLPLITRVAPISTYSQERSVVYVGRLEVRKGVLQLVQACARMWANGSDFILTLIGGDTEFAPRDTTVETFIRTRYKTWVEQGYLQFVGQLPHDQVQERVKQAGVFVIPSIWENFPNTCMEAMALGQVVLASTTGGQAEMIDEDGLNGFVFSWEHEGAFERQIDRIFALNSTEREAVGKNARRRIHNLCAPEVVLPQRLQHYEEVRTQIVPRIIFPTTQPPSAVVEQPATLIGESEQEVEGLLSVIIPFYNLGAYVNETLESAFASNYENYEIVIVNDGSSDAESLHVLAELEARNLPNVRVVHQQNKGLATTRNVGSRVAKGEYIAFLDADDIVEPDFFGQAINVLVRYQNVGFVYSWVRYFGEGSGIWPTWNAEFPYLAGHNMLVPLVVARRRAFLTAGQNKSQFAYNFEDYDGWVSMLAADFRGVSLAEPLVRYRVRPNSMYRECSPNQMQYLYDLLSIAHPALFKQWGAELFQLQLANGPASNWNHPAVQVAEPPNRYIAELERLRDRLWNENKTLGLAWESHVKYIQGQRSYIESLETSCSDMNALLLREKETAATNGQPLTFNDYELGGRIVARVRQTHIFQLVAKNVWLKSTIKRMLRV